MRKSFGIVAAVCCLGGPAAAAAQAPAPVPERRVADGVLSAGVGLGGLTAKEAAARLQAYGLPRAQRRFTVKVGAKAYVLTTGRLRLRFDEAATARRALRAEAGETVAPKIGFRAASLSAFVRNVARATAVAPRSARMRITVRRVRTRRSRYGRRINAGALDRAIRRRLADPLIARGLRPRRLRVRPAIRLVDLKRRNAVIVTVDRAGFRLRLFKRLRYDRSYGIAVGAAGFETPTGLYRIQNKQVNPAWTAPNRPWAGSYAGRTVPGGAPDNPLKARWLGIANGVGIHGTGEPWSIGTYASHGCIRMRVEDVIDLFPRVPVGSRVLIGR